MKNGFFQDSNGDYSSSRLIASVVIGVALIFAEQIILLGGSATSIVIRATAAGTTFLTIAGPAMLFLFSQKKEEGKQEEIKQNLNAKVENPDNKNLIDIKPITT